MPSSSPDRFVLVTGTQSSGTSAIAGTLYHIGVWMGDDLGGRYGSDPEGRCGFEDRTFLRLAKAHRSNFSAAYRHPRQLSRQLAARIQSLQHEARQRGQIAGGKSPQTLGRAILGVVGDNLWVVDCTRPLADAIRSLLRIKPNRRNVPRLQKWYWECKQEVLAAVPREHIFAAPYYDLLADPRVVVEEMAGWLGLQPTARQYDAAVASVRPKMQHIGLAAVEALKLSPT